MRYYLLILLLFLASFVFAQEKDSIALKYGASINAEDLRHHLSILASDEYEGRETGKQGQKKAAEYIGNAFVKLQIPKQKNGSYYQTFPLIEQDKKGITIQIEKRKLNRIDDFYSISGVLKNGKINGKVVFVGYGIETDTYSNYTNIDVSESIVVMLPGVPLDSDGKSLITSEKGANWNRKRKMELAKEKGARAIFVIDNQYENKKNGIRHYANRKKTKVVREGVYETTPSFVIHEMVAEDILGIRVKKIVKQASKNKKPISKEINKTATINIGLETNIISSENVLGYIEGTDKKEELIIITAHYDHLGKKEGLVYNGADDDGSGTVALLEIAEAFSMAKKEGNPSKRSLLFMAVSGEEKGLLGSAYYSDNPIYPLSNTVANLNIDMIGRHDENHKEEDEYVYVIGADKISQELHEINETSNALYTQLKLDYTFNSDDDPNRFYYRSDHYNFAKKNIPVIFYFSGVHEDYHKATDTIDKISFSKLEKRTKLVYYTAWKLANLEERIKLNEGKKPD